MPLKIAIVVHGRFHAFDLAGALLERGHQVTVFTNYPRWAAARFGLPGRCVQSFWPHGALARAADRFAQRGLVQAPERWLHPLFGRWAAAQLSRQAWDAVHGWSGVSEELLADRALRAGLRTLVRGSAHIRTQARLLAEEERRTGAPQDRPSPWIIAREQREYALADRIVLLSTFARDSFIAEGVSAARLYLLPLGARLDAFRPAPEVVEARRQRILAGRPLRILYVGALSFQKGLWDLAAVVRQLAAGRFEFHLVGSSTPESAALLASLEGRATFTPRVPQSQLPSVYAAGDLFVFPTIQDGYAAVLAQAAAAGLPILATTNCAGPDLVREAESGWIVPIRSPEALVERLRWCDVHRAELAAMADRVVTRFQPRDWSDVAADYEALCAASLAR